jgi:hypothetical protein
MPKSLTDEALFLGPLAGVNITSHDTYIQRAGIIYRRVHHFSQRNQGRECPTMKSANGMGRLEIGRKGRQGTGEEVKDTCPV